MSDRQVADKVDLRSADIAENKGLELLRLFPEARTEGGKIDFYAPPGALLLVRQGALVALGFDETRGVVSGEPIPVAQAVGSDPGVARGAFAVSATGVLAHRAGGAERRQLVWVDRAGTVRGTVGPPDENALGNPELAPDGQRVAVQRYVQGNVDVWLIEVGRGVPSRFTFDEGAAASPITVVLNWAAELKK